MLVSSFKANSLRRLALIDNSWQEDVLKNL